MRSEMERGNLLKAIGASGLTLSSFSTVTGADSSHGSQTEELDDDEVNRALVKAQQAEPVNEMGGFLWAEQELK